MSPIIFIVLPILLFSVIIHECAHGIAAYRCGDDTAKLMGRITLNPIPHIDIFGTIIIPVLMIISGAPVIGWAKPVPVNPLNFRKPRRDDIIVSAAGPGSNILLAISSFLFLIVVVNFPLSNISIKGVLGVFFFYLTMINVILAIFNLIPFPPLDGSHILGNILPYSLARSYKSINPSIGMIILYLLILSGLLKYILFPIINIISNLIDVVTPSVVINEMNKLLLK